MNCEIMLDFSNNNIVKVDNYEAELQNNIKIIYDGINRKIVKVTIIVLVKFQMIMDKQKVLILIFQKMNQILQKYNVYVETICLK